MSNNNTPLLTIPPNNKLRLSNITNTTSNQKMNPGPRQLDVNKQKVDVNARMKLHHQVPPQPKTAAMRILQNVPPVPSRPPQPSSAHLSTNQQREQSMERKNLKNDDRHQRLANFIDDVEAPEKNGSSSRFMAEAVCALNAAVSHLLVGSNSSSSANAYIHSATSPNLVQAARYANFAVSHSLRAPPHLLKITRATDNPNSSGIVEAVCALNAAASHILGSPTAAVSSGNTLSAACYGGNASATIDMVEAARGLCASISRCLGGRYRVPSTTPRALNNNDNNISSFGIRQAIGSLSSASLHVFDSPVQPREEKVSSSHMVEAARALNACVSHVLNFRQSQALRILTKKHNIALPDSVIDKLNAEQVIASGEFEFLDSARLSEIGIKSKEDRIKVLKLVKLYNNRELSEFRDSFDKAYPRSQIQTRVFSLMQQLMCLVIQIPARKKRARQLRGFQCSEFFYGLASPSVATYRIRSWINKLNDSISYLTEQHKLRDDDNCDSLYYRPSPAFLAELARAMALPDPEWYKGEPY